MSEILNANPTIRNASDLPTRRQRTSSQSSPKNALGLFSSTIPSLPYLTDPFSAASGSSSDSDSEDHSSAEPIDEQEIYDLISTISDPEHPLSLGSLAVVNLPDIRIAPLSPNSSSPLRAVLVEITPTITHCSLATVIGLGVRVRLEQALPPRFRVDVRIKEGTHSTGEQVNKQLGDKERVAAALENSTLMGVLRKMLETCQ
ncbi:MAG: cytoplasmic required for cell [Lasallia pustulata]|uniref:Cytoplasmic protein required for cell n=1 Tax=Lasallia pustulata TaxID=136370 RepID=A0A1W5CTU1_9LECA|nr:MAG: cytoplasmic required for cell [Lasallia pustulata]SLM34231.1 cytoplasmic protein required for cell [Lasallia pustulata]